MHGQMHLLWGGKEDTIITRYRREVRREVRRNEDKKKTITSSPQ